MIDYDFKADWVKWEAIDLNGDIYRYENEPEILPEEFCVNAPRAWLATGRTHYCGNLGCRCEKWKESKVRVVDNIAQEGEKDEASTDL